MSADDTGPEVQLNAWLGEEPRLTVAAAESCTGGAVAWRLTSLPGSSAYMLGSIVAYANRAKVELLGVPRETIDQYGAVSDQCARAMAEGACRVFGADVAVATTGIAGPGGGTARKPVGLVYLAVAGPAGTEVREHHFAGDRVTITTVATDAALRLLQDAVAALLKAES